MIAVVVGALVLAGLAPWWWTAAAARRRRRQVVARTTAVPTRPSEVLHGDDRPPGDDVRSPPGPVDVAVLLELVATAVGAGVGVPRALQVVGAAVGGADGRTLRTVAVALRLGGDWQSAWDTAHATARAAPVAGGGGRPRSLDPLRDALRGAWTDGVAPGDALRAAAGELRQRRRAAARSAAGRLAVRLVLPLGLCFLPAFVLLGLVPVLFSLGADLVSG
ncbi:type II secretion system F family protein [Isoptericola sp. AK164]|uniref:type II secretion system F family protein n=1 Tax=Isoptericola sp. AK164 TaxID=3024246 RepID=UPI0024181AAB|nr:type II secretion system F family protein [Isoptericola sp. AK164]